MIRNILYYTDIFLRLAVFAIIATVILGVALLHAGMDSLFGKKWWEESL